jgi:outer membrane protein assembly factor BamB
MVKKIAVGLAGVLVAAAVLYAFGVRVALDGSGMWPRFLFRYDYDALEADRARQRAEAPAEGLTAEAPEPAALSAPDVPAAETAPADATPSPAPSGPRRPRVAYDAARAPGYWPDFRGPLRDGRYTETPIRTSWPPEGLPQLWKQPVGGGYASFVVAGGRAFTIEQRRSREVVAAYDVATGREVWTHGWDGAFREAMGGDGPRATPTYHEGRLYALGALGELQCLDARTGALVWRRNILADNDASNLSWGMAASPLVVDDKVIVLPGGPRGQSVVAYGKTTGEPIWKALDDAQAYTSPMLVTLGGVRQILVVSALRIVGLAPEDGGLIWEHPWITSQGISVAQPLVFDDRVFLSAGYGHGARRLPRRAQHDLPFALPLHLV